MAVDSLNRKMSFVATFFAFIGVTLGFIALTTNYWTAEPVLASRMPTEQDNATLSTNEKVGRRWNGLLYICSTLETPLCVFKFVGTTFVLCLVGLIFLFVGGIFVCWDIFKISDRRFIIPMLFFASCVLMTAGLFEYGSWILLNSHSSRTMLAAIVFAYSALPISAFIAGRYSTFDQFVTNGHINNGQKYVSTSTNGN
ncbi:unnamed protein product [Rotaria sordida]|uniref:Uncharacterized protein n=1 Tax=Rotaria sordida TaxID=392033 RepID=A0A820ALA6_9BILA|nr:unnamed protein product [Rotaria sordida]CAF1310569.1 unnamed protein product [Rotaria sordida]CAF1499644.1 unnamed protein product [Rotaria sordida]CAF3886398.1 unnamed protein product [Rotaria sordida]CAF4115171.1 unnamed protein product [Rotaria sordida]